MGPLRAALAADRAVLAPLCLDPLTAILLQRLGFEAGYLSGGALGFQLAVSEALLTVDDMSRTAAAVTRRSDLPLVVDGGVGFGDPVHVARAMWDLEAAGAAAIEIEDQVAPKRVHHHVGVETLVPVETMVAKIEVAVAERTDPDVVVIARTGARRHEGLPAAIERGRAYRDAGADVLLLFLRDEEVEEVRAAVGLPLATFSSIDRQPPAMWDATGWSLVLDAVTGQALPLEALRSAYGRYRAEGTMGAERDGRELHRELVELCGLDRLLDIERRTTVPPEGPHGP